MIPVISPAKNLNFEPASSDYALTTPQFQAEANALAARAQTLSVAEIKALMELSDALAELNHARFQAFEPEPRVDLVKQAALAFAGDT
ncbi:MAG: peroxide stress protein YaaA, partial [Pseudomonadota bacterium]